MKNYTQEKKNFRINWQIKSLTVRVIKGEEQLGIISTSEAIKIAQDDGVDLIEIVPGAKPPVCQILDFGKFKYEQRSKDKEFAKKQRESQVITKELRLRPGIQENDIETKLNQAKKFLAEGMKVQFNLEFRGGRQLSHKEQGFLIIQKVIENLNEVGVVEKNPKMDGKKIICSIAPKVLHE